jgi:hypothetical protein
VFRKTYFQQPGHIWPLAKAQQQQKQPGKWDNLKKCIVIDSDWKAKYLINQSDR